MDSSGIITTVAGDGHPGYGGDGAAATDVPLNSPYGVAVDATGNLYISDTSNHRIRRVDASGIITTVAGNGVEGSSGDGGPAISASLSFPHGVAVDGGGNLYIADSSNQSIRRVDASGVITTVAGIAVWGYSGDGGPATSASLAVPFGVAVDSEGSLYIADTYNNRIRRVDASGIINTVAGNGLWGDSGDGAAATSARLTRPQGVAIDDVGNIFIADTQNRRIRRVDADGIITTLAGDGFSGYSGDGGPATDARLSAASGVTVDAFGNVYIADTYNNRIRMVDTSGIITTVAGNGSSIYPSLSYPNGVAVDGGGNLYFADTNSQRVRRMDAEGIVNTIAGNGLWGYSGDGDAATNARLALPHGVAVDGGGNLYIADTNNQRVRRVDADGTISTVAGDGSRGYSGDGGPATNAHLSFPEDVAVDRTGNLYIADTSNQRIRRVDVSGIITTVVGNGNAGDGGPATSAQLARPVGVAVDGDGNLYIADTNHQRIRRVDASGIITTVAGNGSQGYSGDGGPATSARLYFPFGVAVDEGGNLYIADRNNQRIRRVDASGIITTVAGNGLYGYAGDGGPATDARLANPSSVAVFGLSRLYIADTINNRIRMVLFNSPPTAENQTISNFEDQALEIMLAASDPDQDLLTYYILSRPAHGTLSGPLPSLTYTPKPDYFGPDSFQFYADDGELESNIATVSIDVCPVNDLPRALDDAYSTDEDATLTISAPGLLANDSDVEDDLLTVVPGTEPSHGSLALSPDGSFTYVPDPDFNGLDFFHYLARDHDLGTAEATVHLTVNPVNDPPVAHDQWVVTDEDVFLPITLSGGDVDGDPIAFALTSLPSNGTLEGEAPDLIYTPELNYYGADSFAFDVNDGSLRSGRATVFIDIAPVNDPPQAVDDSYSTDEDTALTLPAPGLLANDSDVEGDDLSAVLEFVPNHGTVALSADGAFTYVPDLNYYGPDSFSYLVEDGQAQSGSAMVNLTVIPVNDAPLADGQSLVTDEDVPLPITLTGSDVESDPLAYLVLSGPSRGILEGTAPHLTYTPAPDHFGEDSFSFKINDGELDSETAWVNIEVYPVNDPPAVDAGPDLPPEGEALREGDVLSIVAHFSDVDSSSHTAWIDWADGTGLQPGSVDQANWTVSASHVYADDGAYSVTVTVQDAEGAASVDSLAASVDNAAPLVTSLVAPLDPVSLDEADIAFSAAFRDAATLDTHTCTIDWGDDTSSVEPVEEAPYGPPGSTEGLTGTVAAGHLYAEAGVYRITLAITDDDGGQGSAGYEYVVVYDPEGGFVTGGGWIDSPQGAYAAEPELAGRASFGFVSKYKRGAEAPTGETEFQFKMADLNFHSDSYDWLVVAGPRAQFKGTGTINGEGSFGFLLSAVDGQINGGGGEDKFRIKIWDQDEDLMVYDNQMGEADDSPASTIIGGGSIVIHGR